MELTRRELKKLGLEGFDKYSIIYDRVLIDTKVNCGSNVTGMKELIARDCKVELTTFNPSHAQRFGSKYDYDLHETMPYLDSEVHQAERLIKTLEFNRYMNFGIMTKDDAYRLSEAKLELISRN